MYEVCVKEKEVVLEGQWKIYLQNNQIYTLPLMGEDWDSSECEVDGYTWVALVKIAIEIGSGDFYHFPLLLGFNETSPFEAKVLLAPEVTEIWRTPPEKVKFMSDAEIESLPQDYIQRTKTLPLAWREVEDVLIGELPFYNPKIRFTEVNSVMNSLRRIRAIEGEWDEMYFPAKGLLAEIKLGYIDDQPCDPYDDIEDCPPSTRWAELILIDQRKGGIDWLGIVENPPILEDSRPLFFIGKWTTKTENPLEDWITFEGLLAVPDDKDVYHWKEVKNG